MYIRSLGKTLSSFQIVILGFLGLILTGTVLLMLPAAAKGGSGASFGDALFTATSAVCVTGLVVQDTATCWSAFGQAVILVLIQIGGLGVVSVAAFIAMVSGRKISLMQRSMLQDSISAHQLGGIVKMTGFLFKTALLAELAGALMMLPAFCGRYGASGVWMSVFHSVSAFCNAGFDVMGDKTGPFSSLTSFGASAGVVLPVCFLIVMGGIGFLTWDDVAAHKLRFRRYRMQSKVVLTTTAVLIAVPALLLFFFEYRGHPAGERILLSLFQAVTPRTAGFNTANLSALSGAARMLLIGLMLIGGSPGSTAGGMKTTTAAVLLANAFSVFRRKKNALLFGRRVEDAAVKNAATLLMMYLFMTLLGAAVISMADRLPVGTCLFETASAIGTVGLSLGITPSLSFLSRLVLIGLMFFGRVGGLTLIYAAVSSRAADVSQRPVEKIIVG
ncbi:MAG: Trk family potassium uptake protein [Oscillospiraceae bacterium]|nr:Trk family potassium uptake protein [Oscillospiraceae bacterium]